MGSESKNEGDRQYRYERFTTSLLFRDMRFRRGAAGPGEPLPAFNIVTTEGDELTNQILPGSRPLLLVFGSITCPMTASAMPLLNRLHTEFGEQVNFIMVNVREAHPGENFRQPTTMAEKLDHARALKQLYEIPWTVATDNIEGSLHRSLDPKPNSAFLVNEEGVIIFRALWSSDESAMPHALESVVAGTALDKLESQVLLGPVARAMGQVQEVMDRAGPQAVNDLWRAGFPMALAGRVATFFTPLSPDQRGVAAVITLLLGMIFALGLISAWLFG